MSHCEVCCIPFPLCGTLMCEYPFVFAHMHSIYIRHCRETTDSGRILNPSTRNSIGSPVNIRQQSWPFLFFPLTELLRIWTILLSLTIAFFHKPPVCVKMHVYAHMCTHIQYNVSTHFLSLTLYVEYMQTPYLTYVFTCG